ncbi:MAG: hypothetical protein QF399_03810 [Gammaproteobacteria bacterium]|nr:hypothetical protein [Gammaproteobacteria bacterium]
MGNNFSFSAIPFSMPAFLMLSIADLLIGSKRIDSMGTGKGKEYF